MHSNKPNQCLKRLDCFCYLAYFKNVLYWHDNYHNLLKIAFKDIRQNFKIIPTIKWLPSLSLNSLTPQPTVSFNKIQHLLKKISLAIPNTLWLLWCPSHHTSASLCGHSNLSSLTLDWRYRSSCHSQSTGRASHSNSLPQIK